ncbi:MAG: SRPBCC family protein [bacterium]
MLKSEDIVVIEHTYDVPLEKVWNAITKHEELLVWFFDNIPEFQPTVGFKTQFNVKAPSKDFSHKWKVVAVDHLNQITVNWQFQGHPGSANVTMKLHEENNQTHFILIDEILEPFDTSIPEFKRESSVEGWNYFIKKRLQEYLTRKN